MKNIPIVILNKDRLTPLIPLVQGLKQRGYHNITVLDNLSTYEPLLAWYKSEGLDVFYNDIPETKYDTGTLFRLAFEIKHPKFVDIVKSHYAFTDSDIVLGENCPENFIEHLVTIRDSQNVSKAGLALKIDDLPKNHHTETVIRLESPLWSNRIESPTYEMYRAAIDTTFAVYGPNETPLYSENSIRVAGDYTATHRPWYYEIDNMPDDERYYLTKLEAGKGPNYSMMIKNTI